MYFKPSWPKQEDSRFKKHQLEFNGVSPTQNILKQFFSVIEVENQNFITNISDIKITAHIHFKIKHPSNYKIINLSNC